MASHCKDYYFYSPQSSTVIKSKMATTTILQTQTRFRPPKIPLHCRLPIFRFFFVLPFFTFHYVTVKLIALQYRQNKNKNENYTNDDRVKNLFNFYLIFFFRVKCVFSDQRQVHAASVSLWLHKKQMAKKSEMDII